MALVRPKQLGLVVVILFLLSVAVLGVFANRHWWSPADTATVMSCPVFSEWHVGERGAGCAPRQWFVGETGRLILIDDELNIVLVALPSTDRETGFGKGGSAKPQGVLLALPSGQTIEVSAKDTNTLIIVPVTGSAHTTALLDGAASKLEQQLLNAKRSEIENVLTTWLDKFGVR